MYKTVDSSEFIDLIRAIDPVLKNIKLKNVQVEKNSGEISFVFICDNTVNDQLKTQILNLVEQVTPPQFNSVKVIVNKIVSNAELINAEIYKYVTENFPSISIFLKPTDVITSEVGDLVKYAIKLTEDGAEYAQRGGVLKKINQHLSTRFCSEFAGSTQIKPADETFSLLSDEVYVDQIQKIEHRTIQVKDVVVIDDITMDNVALYIEDVKLGQVTVCGKITEIKERVSKNDKPFFIIHIDDTTAELSGIYFSKKNTLGKIRDLVVGDCIIARVSVKDEVYKGQTQKRYTFEKINRCTFPEDFVKKEKFKKPVPIEYKNIFPQPATTVKVKSVFDVDLQLPKELTDNTYVVFDLETTGLDPLSSGITEIGAVKIIDGKIAEQFHTLVKPDYPITDEIVKITGITEELVKDAPKISTVMPDFIKFIDGTILIAHNGDAFDFKFLRRFATAEEFEMKNKTIDSLDWCRKYLHGLKKHDLHTVADKFGIVFHHHRALSDSYATAEVFIELMKIKNANQN
ncbi:MAG: ribonuclease H-like domain-containing protein [Clostridia bacterium]|nr:ribonuclease H-like domain-containing protein [Clostridia bacterium]